MPGRTCAINTFETIISKLEFQNGFCRRAVALHADDGRQQQQELKLDSFFALKGLPYSFVVKVRRRPRRAVALLLLQLSRRLCRVDVVIAAAAAASSPALLVRATAAAEELRRLPAPSPRRASLTG